MLSRRLAARPLRRADLALAVYASWCDDTFEPSQVIGHQTTSKILHEVIRHVESKSDSLSYTRNPSIPYENPFLFHARKPLHDGWKKQPRSMTPERISAPDPHNPHRLKSDHHRFSTSTSICSAVHAKYPSDLSTCSPWFLSHQSPYPVF
jgi:hypothetical protein